MLVHIVCNVDTVQAGYKVYSIDRAQAGDLAVRRIGTHIQKHHTHAEASSDLAVRRIGARDL